MRQRHKKCPKLEYSGCEDPTETEIERGLDPSLWVKSISYRNNFDRGLSYESIGGIRYAKFENRVFGAILHFSMIKKIPADLSPYISQASTNKEGLCQVSSKSYDSFSCNF